MTEDTVVICGMARTPMGGFQGDLKDASATELGAFAMRGALDDAALEAPHVDEVIMGCVLPAGLGQAPARQASLGAGISLSTGCTTINKMCGSGLKAVMMAHDLIRAGSNDVMVAGGLESMSNAPYLLTGARAGLRMGHGQVSDHMFLDGLEDAYEKGRLMGSFAEQCAQKYGFSREIQDEFAIRSLSRARAAIDNGWFDREVVAVNIKSRRGEKTVHRDEQPHKANLEKIPQLKPAFEKGGSVTAANSSSISDGAAALVLCRASTASDLGLQPLAEILGHSTFAHEPGWFTTAPVFAIRALLDKLNWTTDDVDLYEINEAFAVVTLAAMTDLKLPADKVNIHGGACALGHPVGASGARILVTLLAAMEKNQMHTGVASLCIGGGEATALAVKRL